MISWKIVINPYQSTGWPLSSLHIIFSAVDEQISVKNAITIRCEQSFFMIIIIIIIIIITFLFLILFTKLEGTFRVTEESLADNVRQLTTTYDNVRQLTTTYDPQMKTTGLSWFRYFQAFIGARKTIRANC